MNNGLLHNAAKQQYMSEMSRCTYYFDTGEYENRLKANYNKKEFAAFCIQESDNLVDVYITIPDGYNCVHYKKGVITSSIKSKESHLTYHGHPKRKKLTGEIHIVSSVGNPLKGMSSYTDAPLAASSNIQVHPLPICRIELSEVPGRIYQHPDIRNYFEAKIPDCYFNTLEVHVAKRGYMYNLASANLAIPAAWASLFVHMSMHAYFLGKLERRPGRFPQALCVQTKRYELIVLATHEYKNQRYEKNTIKYFHTKDYFRDLGRRNVIKHQNGWFIDQLSDLKKKPGSIRLSELL